MRTAAGLPTLVCLCVALLGALPALAKEKDKDKEDRAKFLTRSIYLPVELKLCEHLKDAVLYEGEQMVSVLPARRIFQFTYYPQLSRIEPERTDIRVEGVRTDGTLFTARLAVTPFGVFTANHKIQLDMDQQLAKMRYKLDVRYQPLTLRLRCSDSCEKEPAATATAVVGDLAAPK